MWFHDHSFCYSHRYEMILYIQWAVDQKSNYLEKIPCSKYVFVTNISVNSNKFLTLCFEETGGSVLLPYDRR